MKPCENCGHVPKKKIKLKPCPVCYDVLKFHQGSFDNWMVYPYLTCDCGFKYSPEKPENLEPYLKTKDVPTGWDWDVAAVDAMTADIEHKFGVRK